MRRVVGDLIERIMLVTYVAAVALMVVSIWGVIIISLVLLGLWLMGWLMGWPL